MHSELEVFEHAGKSFVRDPVDGPLEVKYGLPGNVRFCTRCVMSNQRPASAVEFKHNKDSKKVTLRLDADGVCDACRYAERKSSLIDWGAREHELRMLCEKFRSRNGSYDCLVPGSGGKDSVFASHVLKTRYGMHPLTVTWAPHLYTDVGFRNFQSWVHKGGFDNYLFTPDGIVHRKLTRLAFRNLLHPFQPFILGQKNFAPKMAAKMGLNLVFYGENEAEYGNPINENVTALRHASYFSASRGLNEEMYFGGVPMSELRAHDILPGQLDSYMPADPSVMSQSAIDVHYLGYYLKWEPQENYYYSVEHIDFEANTERTEGTYSKYSGIDDKTDPFHFWTTLVKFGIGRTTYDASQEIRNGHISRQEAIALVDRYDQEFPLKYFPEFLEYLGMEEAEFFEVADGFRSPHIWKSTSSGWKLRNLIS